MDLKHALLIDSNSSDYSRHLTSGVPLLGYAGENDDVELPKLSNYLWRIAQNNSAPLTAQNASNFKLHKLLEAPNEKTALSTMLNLPSV